MVSDRFFSPHPSKPLGGMAVVFPKKGHRNRASKPWSSMVKNYLPRVHPGVYHHRFVSSQDAEFLRIPWKKFNIFTIFSSSLLEQSWVTNGFYSIQLSQLFLKGLYNSIYKSEKLSIPSAMGTNTWKGTLLHFTKVRLKKYQQKNLTRII